MNKKLSLTIGIPAYNEEKNIVNMLDSVTRQKNSSFTLESILVVSDGSNDKTEMLVRQFAKKNKKIMLIADGKRLGKASRLNQIFKLNKSDFIGTFDADIFFDRDIELDLMMKKILTNNAINVVAGNQYPQKSPNLMGKFSIASFHMFYEAAKNYRNGNNIHCLQGSSSILRKDFAKSLNIPFGIGCDQAFLYLSTIRKNRDSFAFVKNTHFIFSHVSTFKDWRVLGYRTIIQDKKDIIDTFGQEALKEYHLPKELIAKSIFSSFLRKPFNTLGAIAMNFYIRKFPIKKSAGIKSGGIWRITRSSKEAIVA